MRTSLRFLVVAALAASPVTFAQLELPAASPLATVSQRVGLTDLSVEYSSPAVKGRQIWGGLVPYDQLWRAGANAATKVTFSEAVRIGGKELPAGSYALLAIPGKDQWTLVLNRNLAIWATRGYDQKDDVVRVNVKPTAIPHRERLAYLFADFTDERANLDLEWEKVRVSLPIELGTAAHAKRNVDRALGGTWQMYNSAARYQLTSNGDLDSALKWIDTSIQLNETWFNNWTKAQLLAAKGRHKDAVTFAKKAQALGSKNPERFFYANDVKQAIADWQKKR